LRNFILPKKIGLAQGVSSIGKGLYLWSGKNQLEAPSGGIIQNTGFRGRTKDVLQGSPGLFIGLKDIRSRDKGFLLGL
jgi:hypothetical protein